MKIEGTDRLGFLLHDAARLMRKRFEARGAMHGLSAAQWRALVRVSKEEGITQARLADLLEIEPISVSRLLDRMEEAGWIERRQHPTDRRIRAIYPTPRSRPVFEEIKAMAVEIYEEALQGLSPEARRATLEGLGAIVANLAAEDPQAVQQSNYPKGNAA